MFVAYDKDKNRVYADDSVKHTGCVCPACNAEVIHRAVDSLHRVPHFAHKPKTKCSYEFDKDYMSEWHRRMQGYFAKEEIEYRFTNEADEGRVFISNEIAHGLVRDQEVLGIVGLVNQEERDIILVHAT